MKNKKILALAIASILGLTACGDDSTDLRIDDTIKDSLNRQSSIAFDLISTKKTVSTPTNLLMDTSDGTLNIPIDKDDDKTRANPAVAMGDTDGWSPTQPFIIKLDLPTGVTLTTDSALLHAAVKIAKVDVSRANVMSNPVALTAGVDYTVISTGTSLAVLPLKGSLEHGSDYIYAITDALVDSSGQKLGMSTSYAALKNKQIDQTGSKLEIPQKIVLQVEGLMDAYGIADYENIIYSSWFTTSSAGEALYSVKMATASALAGKNLWKDGANPNNSDLSKLYKLSGLTPKPLGPLDAVIKGHTGVIELPSFLERGVTDEKWKKTPWQSAMPSLAIINGVLTSGSDKEKLDLVKQLRAAGIDPAKLADPTEQLKLVGKSFKLNGEPLDSERLITKYSPLPQVKSVEKVNFLLITPRNVPVGTKVPVVIYQHGITSIKENILASGAALAAKGYAILAIDLPLHGERKLSDDTVTNEAHADVFMNFTYLPVARDNLRQAVADLIGLRAGLNLIVTTPGTELDVLDTSKVSFFGHSLGAMTGISLQATIDRPLPDSNNDGVVGDGDQYFKIDKAAFANPGGGIPYLLLNSEEFGGTVKHGLMAASDTQDKYSNGYINFVGNQCDPDPVNNPDTDKPLKDNKACFNGYYDYIELLKPGTQTKIDATFQSFAVAAQTVLETADPFALARKIKDTPVYLAQVKGDSVIPNFLDPKAGYAAAYSPIAGTEPLMTQLKLKNIYTFTDTNKKAALFLAGEHSSVILDYTGHADHPNADTNTTNELQSHITNFLTGDGSTIGNIDNSLLDPKSVP
ncbi:VolA/Pla-1 family phospholipase [Moritella viscosa]|uniref:Hydrolases of the alpha/beta superfamily n=1 Tax=Moritella viscosa TaxID=80854 RepID=A0ABY1HN53_9GAMM|nr:VolA/Pla-1 family phospholipase [Moritella viscosa]SGY90159.1 Hydrolases of the alpha/beta superfamily [Moritella viscosa]SGY92829.1 Hydrolases of the alpha/beta superfamily [Moritella viscosa]SGZ02407.1 Hydrolases of the alpha/beta superfamily [Moritella viscosa]SHO25317.1 Hydrolases of the alpha/beta superfamily [Moritella viscosa]